jgi:hypothetical protein
MTRTVSRAALAVTAALSVLLVSMPTPQAQVSNAVRTACERKANKVTPPLRAGEREAYITNCLADAAPTPGKTKKKKY